jgi:hypothetical protein
MKIKDFISDYVFYTESVLESAAYAIYIQRYFDAEHKTINHSRTYSMGDTHTNTIESPRGAIADVRCDAQEHPERAGFRLRVPLSHRPTPVAQLCISRVLPTSSQSPRWPTAAP